jgi:hypothetical protein
MAGRGDAPRLSAMKSESHTCTLTSALGERETCPGEPCPFWGEGACAIAGLRADLRGTRGLAGLLLRLREELGVRAPDTYGLVPPVLR